MSLVIWDSALPGSPSNKADHSPSTGPRRRKAPADIRKLEFVRGGFSLRRSRPSSDPAGLIPLPAGISLSLLVNDRLAKRNRENLVVLRQTVGRSPGRQNSCPDYERIIALAKGVRISSGANTVQRRQVLGAFGDGCLGSLLPPEDPRISCPLEFHEAQDLQDVGRQGRQHQFSGAAGLALEPVPACLRASRSWRTLQPFSTHPASSS